MSGRLAGKVALVTGASRGIGRAVASVLAREGADLVLTSTQPRGCDAALREATASKRRAVAVAADLATSEGLKVIWKTASEAFGRIDILVNNAGTAPLVRMTAMTDAVWERVMAVNLTAAFGLSRRVLPGMLARRYGRIVNVSSISSTLGTAGFTGYCASKWGMNGLTKALAEELRGTGVLVTAVLPGTVNTEMSKVLGYPPQMEPGEVAETIRYLCAEAPSALQGALIEMFG